MDKKPSLSLFLISKFKILAAQPQIQESKLVNFYLGLIWKEIESLTKSARAKKTNMTQGN